MDEIREGVAAAKTADRNDDSMDREEWDRIEKGKGGDDLEKGGDVEKRA